MRTIFIPLLLLRGTDACPASTPENIAVGDLSAQGLEQSSAGIISDRLRAGPFQDQGVERSRMPGTTASSIH